MAIKNHDGVPTFIPGTTTSIRHISAAQLEMFEVNKIAFIKPVMTENGQEIGRASCRERVCMLV